MSASALRCPPQAAAESEPRKAVFETDVVEPGLDLASTLRAITTKYGKTYQRLLLDLAKASFGPGRLSYDEFIGLRLFDDAWLAGADISAFVGLDAERRIWMAANNNSEWWGLMRNKLAVTTLLGGYGFPVIPTLALYSDAICMRGVPVLREPEALAGFLRGSRDYPLFGKPMDSQRSLGSIGLEAYDRGTDSLVTGPDRKIRVDEFAAAVAEHYKGGYIFQRRIAPHARVRAIAGDRLATVRAITILTDRGPQLLRALWKIPAGDNVADNFWRSGNLLATLDLETAPRRARGARHRARPGGGDASPGHGGRARSASRCRIGARSSASPWMPPPRCAEVPLIGWDMAAVEGGALIVEPNFTPDFFMTQLADRRGMLDARFNAFLEGCKAAAQQTKRKRRSRQTAERHERLRRLGRDMTGTSGCPIGSRRGLRRQSRDVRDLLAELGVRATLELPDPPIIGSKRKKEAAGASAPGGLQKGNEAAYADFIVPVTVLKVALICEPSPRAAAMMPTAIRAAMRPYSMAVAPDSSFTKRSTWFFMTTLPTHSLHEASAVVHP